MLCWCCRYSDNGGLSVGVGRGEWQSHQNPRGRQRQEFLEGAHIFHYSAHLDARVVRVGVGDGLGRGRDEVARTKRASEREREGGRARNHCGSRGGGRIFVFFEKNENHLFWARRRPCFVRVNLGGKERHGREVNSFSPKPTIPYCMA